MQRLFFEMSWAFHQYLIDIVLSESSLAVIVGLFLSVHSAGPLLAGCTLDVGTGRGHR